MSNAIKVTFPGGCKVAAEVGGRTVLTDQPAAEGGDDAAPKPSELFLASLATCGGLFAYTFCCKREIDTAGLDLTVDVETDARTHLISRLVFNLTLPMGFPPKYRDAIVKAVEACYVKKHLAETVVVEVALTN